LRFDLKERSAADVFPEPLLGASIRDYAAVMAPDRQVTASNRHPWTRQVLLPAARSRSSASPCRQGRWPRALPRHGDEESMPGRESLGEILRSENVMWLIGFVFLRRNAGMEGAASPELPAKLSSRTRRSGEPGRNAPTFVIPKSAQRLSGTRVGRPRTSAAKVGVKDQTAQRAARLSRLATCGLGRDDKNCGKDRRGVLLLFAGGGGASRSFSLQQQKLARLPGSVVCLAHFKS